MIDPIPAKPPLARLPLWVPPVLLAILASLTFSAGLTGSFVLDDDSAAAQHPVVQGKTPLIDAFTLNFWGRPLSAFPPAFRPLTHAIVRRRTTVRWATRPWAFTSRPCSGTSVLC